MTGPTFVGDTLLLSIQHPSECPFNGNVFLDWQIELLTLDGSSIFNRQRRVNRGSNWPSNIQGDPQGPPRPSVIGIRRKDSRGRFI